QVGGAETYARGLLGALAERPDVERIEILANREVEAAYGERVGGRVGMRRIDGMEPGGGAVGRTLRLAAGLAAPGRLIDGPSRDLDLVHFPIAVAIPRPPIPYAVTLHDVAHHAVKEFFTRADRAYRALAYDRSATKADL